MAVAGRHRQLLLWTTRGEASTSTADAARAGQPVRADRALMEKGCGVDGSPLL